jgi:glycosyltransferase involved in cell wall biosynthesis
MTHDPGLDARSDTSESSGNPHLDVDVLVYMPFPSREMTGGPRSMLALLLGLDEAGYRVALFTHQVSALSEACGQHGIPVVLAATPSVLFADTGRQSQVGVRALIREIFGVRKVANRALDGVAAKVVCARSALAVAFIARAARIRGIPIVWDIALESGRSPAKWTLGLLAAVRSSRWVLQSRALIDPAMPRIVAAVFSWKIRENTPGLEPASLAGLADVAAKRTRRALRNPADELRVLCLGTVSTRKNQLSLIKASCMAAAETGRKIRLDLVGKCDEGYRKELFGHIESPDVTLVFNGWQGDVSRFLEESDVLCIPSIAEGMPHVFREGTACGIPIISSGAGGMRTLMSHGATGLLFDPSAPDQLASCLRLAIERPSEVEAMGWAGRDAHLASFSNRGWLQRYEGVLRELL